MDKLRSYGVSEFVSLPQIVVCGDQSAGKSSVLEAITEIRFPSKDNLCTTFATEIILRRSLETKVSVRIIPSASGTEPSQEKKDKLAAFHHSMKSFDDLPELIEKAKLAMDLNTGATFSRDVLSIEISGPTQPHLTVVDLPGLIHVAPGRPTDVQLVSDLVASYMNNPRTIILAVVSAKNDYQNQIVLQRAKAVDPEGRRTLGVITKPDSLSVGSESEAAFIRLAKNEDISFGLGWHVLRNRCFEERDTNFEERNRAEERFFQTGVWMDIARSSVGIGTLRSRLSRLLYDHIKGELPTVYRDICAGLNSSEEKLVKLGDKRETTSEQRVYLTKLSMDFVSVCRAAVDGYYEDTFFGKGVAFEESDVPKRLRAVVQKMNSTFAKTIREKGHTHQIDKKSDTTGINNRYPHGNAGPKRITHSEAIAWVKPLIENGRGRELSGTFNPILVCPLFHEQSKKWEGYAVSHLNQVFAACREFLSQLIPHVSKGNTTVSTALFQRWFNEVMNQRLAEAKSELGKLFEDRRRHAITYNHYYTGSIQQMEKDDAGEMHQEIVRQFSNATTGRYHSEVALDFKNRLEAKEAKVNMEEYACELLLRSMLAYYKVASETFIDNVATQVIERHLMSGLWDIFSPLSVVSMTDQRVASIATESDENRTMRNNLEVKKERLMMGVDACRRVLPDIEMDIEMEDEAGNP
ncbi:hypothetical protein K440DRAFT_583381 [Wilcoxina mikolae CBS 423.85]|nr:hypothetical protein K440DRAFT_583381 [Wilcoxina mikolae CBS 423.85]